MYFWVKNKKLKIKNLPTKPANGGIPDIDKIINTEVIDIKLCLLKTFKLLNVLIFFTSYKKSKPKKRYNMYMYKHTLK